MKDTTQKENPRTGYMETVVTMESGHKYIMGTYHDCDEPGCPAGAMNDNE